MKITEIKNQDLELHLRICIPCEIIKQDEDKEIAKIKEKIVLNGFRKGRVPRKILEQRYGIHIREDVKNQAMEGALKKILADKKLNLVKKPEIENIRAEQDKDFNFDVKFEIFPQVLLPDLTHMEIEKPFIKVKESDIKLRISQLYNGSDDFFEISEEKIVKGDKIYMDCSIYENNQLLEDSIKNEMVIVGESDLHSEIEKKLIDLRKGDNENIIITLPKNYKLKAFIEKTLEYRINIKKVLKLRKGFVVDEEFAKKFKFATVQDLKQKLEEEIADNNSSIVEAVMKINFFNKLENELNFLIPKSIFDTEMKNIKNEEQKYESQQKSSQNKLIYKNSGLDFGEFELLGIANKSSKEKERYYNKLAKRRIKIALFFLEYIKVNNIVVREEEIFNEIQIKAKAFGNYEKEMIKLFQNNAYFSEEIKKNLLEKKALEVIFSKLKYQEKEYDTKSLKSLLKTINSI